MEIRGFFFLIHLFVGFSHSEGENRMEEQFEMCCNLGTSWASEGLRCEKFVGPVSGVPQVEQGLCLEAVDICCIKMWHEKNCEKGKNNARKGLACAESSKARGKRIDDYQRDCCEGCKLGILTGSMGQGCAFKSFSFGRPWDPTFLECCHEILSTAPAESTETTFTTSTSNISTFSSTKDTSDSTSSTDSSSDSSSVSADGIPTPEVDDICKLLKGLLCSDICVPTPGSYRCECPEGSVLLEDQKTCRTDGPIDRCKSDNPCEHKCVDTGMAIKCECNSGFTLEEDGHSCASSSTTPIAMTSTPTEETKQTKPMMKCPLGYHYNSKARVCDDIDECKERIDICGDEICYNQPGGYSCIRAPTPVTTRPVRQEQLPTSGPMQCAAGLRYVRNRGCADVDECKEIEDICTSNEECSNTVGSYICNCRMGFRRDNLTQACVDINECQLENDCLPTQRCDNTLGSYNCVRFLPCGTGYTLNAATELCEDDDECIMGTHDCSDGYHCRNTLGSYRCDRNPRGYTWTTRPSPPPTSRRPTAPMTTAITQMTTTMMTPVIGSRNQPERTCPRGFQAGPSGQCVDIDECSLGPANPCARSPLQRCVNTIGSYRCVSRVICGSGYTLDPRSDSHCIDVDECTDGTHQCARGQTCENRQGGYACICPPGHTLGPNRDCIDIDECSIYSRNICGNTGKCENTVGSYRCICDEGFERANGGGCEDVDECTRTQGICQHKCINVWGSYKCICQSGYTLNHDNRSCSDVDECQIYKNNNLCVGICDNTPGSYSCRCPDGYRLGEDKRTCQDIDECAAGQLCRDPNEMCQNTRGGYRCNRVQCPHGYHRDQDRKNRCVRSSHYCPAGDVACYRSPSHYSFNFITFVSFLPIPRTGQLELFTMRGTHLPGSNVRFSMALVDARAPPGVTRATESCFTLREPSASQAVLVLTRSLQGPQEIELDLSMEIYHNSAFAGSAVAKLFIYVTQYEF